MKKKKIIRYSLLSLFLLVSVSAFYFYQEFNRTHKDTAGLTPDYTVPAASLIREFETNEQMSNKKYWDKVLRVKGTVKEITKDDKGLFSVVLGDAASMSSVRCSIDSLHTSETKTVKEGDLITVKGICSGFNADELLGSDVILVRVSSR